MNYHLLDSSEWSRLTDLMDPSYIPDSSTAAAAVAEDEEGNIKGVLFMQLAMHMEPLVLMDRHVRFDHLYKTLYNAMSENKGLRFYAFADKEVVAKMAEHVGMKQTPYVVFEGKVD